MTTVALYSNKGGVGKTAATVNLSYVASQTGLRTLVIDLDPQSSATYCFRVRPKLKRKAQNLSRPGRSIEKSIKGTDYEKLDLLPAVFTHRSLDVVFDGLKRSKSRLRKLIEPLQNEYELIMFDCPPTISVVAENIFNAADYVLVPLVPTAFSVRAYRQLASFLAEKDYRTDRLHIFFSMVDLGNRMQLELAKAAFIEFAGVLHSPIPYLSYIEQMDVRREPVPAFAPKSAAASAYRNLWAEIQNKLL